MYITELIQRIECAVKDSHLYRPDFLTAVKGVSRASWFQYGTNSGDLQTEGLSYSLKNEYGKDHVKSVSWHSHRKGKILLWTEA